MITLTCMRSVMRSVSLSFSNVQAVYTLHRMKLERVPRKKQAAKYTKRNVKRADKAIEVRRRPAYTHDGIIPYMHSINNTIIPVCR